MTVSVRKCIVCSRQMPKEQLIRIVRNQKNKLQLDPDFKIEGRGFYVCPSVQCIADLKEKYLLERKTTLSVDPEIYLDIAKIYKDNKKNNLNKLIGFATRSRKLVVGFTAVENYARRNKVFLIIMERETQKNTRNSIYSLYKQNKIPFYVYNESETLEQITGRANCKCIGITDRDFSRQLIREFNRKNTDETELT